jgi:hypothetical protein
MVVDVLLQYLALHAFLSVAGIIDSDNILTLKWLDLCAYILPSFTSICTALHFGLDVPEDMMKVLLKGTNVGSHAVS